MDRQKHCPKFRLKSPNFIYKSSKIVSNFSPKSYLGIDEVHGDREDRDARRLPRLGVNAGSELAVALTRSGLPTGSWSERAAIR